MFHGYLCGQVPVERRRVVGVVPDWPIAMRYNQTLMGAFSGRITSFLGGFVFGKNGVGRTYNTPVNPQTTSQQLVRALFLFLTSAWKSLTNVQREAWETARTIDYWAKQDPFTGTSRPYNSGKSLFIATNTNYAVTTGAVAAPTVAYTTPGSPDPNDEITAVSVVVDASAQTVAVSFTGVFLNENAIFKASPPVSPGNMRAISVKTAFRVVGSGSPTSPWALGTEYVALFGGITGATGQKVFWTLEGVNLASGKSRLIASGDTVIVA